MAHDRSVHSLLLEDPRALTVYGTHNCVAKLLEIRENPGPIQTVLIHQTIRF